MSDPTLNYYVGRGTTAERTAFVPDPATPAAGPALGYLWWDTDTASEWAYDFVAVAWVELGGGSGGGNVNAGGTLTANALVIGAGSTDVAALGSLGTTTTVLHGNAAGAPTFGAVSLTADVTGVLPTANGGRRVAQVVTLNSSGVATGATQIPADNSIPQQSTEGVLVMSQAITPTNASSTLVIEVATMGASDTTARILTTALFQDSTEDALAATGVAVPGANSTTSMVLVHSMTAGTTSATTFKVHLGLSSTGTFTFNGSGGTVRYGAITKSSIVITEVLP